MAERGRGTLARFFRSAGAAGVASGAARALSTSLPGNWKRTSFTGEPVSLTEGAVATAGLLGASAVAGGRGAFALGSAVLSSGAAGYIDDHLEDRFPAKGKGLHGHLGALREGKLTSGALKILVIGAGAGISALALPRSGSRARRMCEWATQSAVIAGSANIINLLDLRPGRALKAASLISAGLLASSQPVAQSAGAGVLATSAVCAADDLAGRTMLGDLGANSLGGALGVGLASLGPTGRSLTLATILGLTFASEKVSFSKVIESTTPLAWLDSLGRQPVSPVVSADHVPGHVTEPSS
ncbi:hypothetical protein I6E29_02630 [Arcanobacterium haemolyticum]|nr:hypothetical protein [Arcanobacterium haemolyticum]